MALCVYSISDSKVFIFLIVFYLHKKLYCVVMFTKERKKKKNEKWKNNFRFNVYNVNF